MDDLDGSFTESKRFQQSPKSSVLLEEYMAALRRMRLADVRELIATFPRTAIGLVTPALARIATDAQGVLYCPPAKSQLDKDGRQRNHCFACGAHGDVIEFLRRYDNPDCGSAVVKLASALAAAIRKQRSVIAAFATAGGPS